DGGTGISTLTGPNQTNIWQLTGSNSGTLDGSLAFTRVARLTGGTGSDAFQIGSSGSLSGRLSGGAGSDTLDYTGYGAGISVNLQTATAPGLGSFASIE